MGVVRSWVAANADRQAVALVNQIEELSENGGIGNYSLAMMGAAKLQFLSVTKAFQYGFLIVALEFRALPLSGVSYGELFEHAVAYGKQSLMTPLAILNPSLAVKTADSLGIRQKQLWQRIKRASTRLHTTCFGYLKDPVVVTVSGIGIVYLTLTTKVPNRPEDPIKIPATSYAPLLFCAMPLFFGGGYGIGKWHAPHIPPIKPEDPNSPPKEHITISFSLGDTDNVIPRIESPHPAAATAAAVAPVVDLSQSPIGDMSLDDVLSSFSDHQIPDKPGTSSVWLQDEDMEHLVYFTKSGEAFVFYNRVIRGKMIEDYFCLHGYHTVLRANSENRLNDRYHFLHDLFAEYQLRVLERSRLRNMLDKFDGDNFRQLEWNLIAANATNKDEAVEQLNQLLLQKYSDKKQKELQLACELFKSLDLADAERINEALVRDRREEGDSVEYEQRTLWILMDLSANKDRLLAQALDKLDRFNKRKAQLQKKIKTINARMIQEADRAQSNYDAWVNNASRRALKAKLDGMPNFKQERNKVFDALNLLREEFKWPKLDIRNYNILSPGLGPVPASPRSVPPLDLNSGGVAPPRISPRSSSFELNPPAQGTHHPSVSPRSKQVLEVPVARRPTAVVPILELDKVNVGS
ncbi:MAG: hypothetical protein Q8K75_02620 [Chlamydiales bacterium]|nr:hypothetical protein [Chlamydiales bacterium]